MSHKLSRPCWGKPGVPLTRKEARAWMWRPSHSPPPGFGTSSPKILGSG